MLKVSRWSTMSEAERATLLGRGAVVDVNSALGESIASLVRDVADRGDEAVCDALLKHDGVRISPKDLAVSPEEFAAATAAVGDDLRSAIRLMIANIRRFNEELYARRSSWRSEIAPGHVIGEQIGPIDSVAVFCPSGKASYPSVLAQVATPAIVAGVDDVIVIVPPVPGGSGEIDPAVLVVAEELGIDRVFRVNGPAGVAAAAFGTESIPACSKVLGPGSPPVALAQLEVRRSGTDTVVLGPSESLIVADGSADISLLAADLLNEAEHGTDSTVLLVTADVGVVEAVDVELDRQAAVLPDERRTAVRAALGMNGGAILVESHDQAFDVANWFAPEHLQLAVADASDVVGRIRNAGEILVGQATPISAGNFVIGCPAALPTGGFAKHSSGITVESYLKATSIGQLSGSALESLADATVVLAEHEGFPAHANAIRIRRQ